MYYLFWVMHSLDQNIGLLLLVSIVSQKWALLWSLQPKPLLIGQDIQSFTYFESKHKVATPCFDHHTKVSSAVKVASKTIKTAQDI